VLDPFLQVTLFRKDFALQDSMLIINGQRLPVFIMDFAGDPFFHLPGR
jgi:hypothetical protein